jgi:hypothetical protein
LAPGAAARLSRRGAAYDLIVLTVEQAARRVGRSPETVRRWIVVLARMLGGRLVTIDARLRRGIAGLGFVIGPTEL